MTVTSAQANKLLGRLKEQLTAVMSKEKQSCVFNAAMGEDVETVRPAYNYTKTQEVIDELNAKIRKVKHAINVFNSTTVIPEFNITIDEALVLIPQLSKKCAKLSEMKARLPKSRVNGFRGVNIIDYEITNYDISAVEKDYDAVAEELSKLQTALDLVNSTVVFELSI